jgi:hypothetical protein
MFTYHISCVLLQDISLNARTPRLSEHFKIFLKGRQTVNDLKSVSRKDKFCFSENIAHAIPLSGNRVYVMKEGLTYGRDLRYRSISTLMKECCLCRGNY